MTTLHTIIRLIRAHWPLAIGFIVAAILIAAALVVLALSGEPLDGPAPLTMQQYEHRLMDQTAEAMSADGVCETCGRVLH